MKKFLLAALMAGVASSAMAADLPTRKAPPAPMSYAPPVFSWTGFYVGVNGGWGGTSGGNDFGSPTGGLVGGTVGYNYQISQFVTGLEGDWDWADINKSGVNGFVGPYSNKIDQLMTARARVGYAFDRALCSSLRAMQERRTRSAFLSPASRRPIGAAAARSAAASNTPSPTTSRPRSSTSMRLSRTSPTSPAPRATSTSRSFAPA